MIDPLVRWNYEDMAWFSTKSIRNNKKDEYLFLLIQFRLKWLSFNLFIVLHDEHNLGIYYLISYFLHENFINCNWNENTIQNPLKIIHWWTNQVYKWTLPHHLINEDIYVFLLSNLKNVNNILLHS